MLKREGEIEEEKAHVFSCRDPFSDEYPIILYEPNIDPGEKKTLKDFVGKNESIHYFCDPYEAEKFAQSLERSFVLIISDDVTGGHLLESFKNFENTYERKLADFEEGSLFQQVFTNNLDEIIQKSLKVCAFYTRQDFADEVLTNKEMDIMVTMYNLSEPAQKFRREYLSWESQQKGESAQREEDLKSLRGHRRSHMTEPCDFLFECILFCERGLEDLVKVRKREKLKMICYVNLAESFANFGVHLEALELYQRALGILKCIYGETHPSAKWLEEKIQATEKDQKDLKAQTMVSYCKIAEKYRKFGLQRKALDYYMKALDVSRIFNGENHEETANRYSDIGFVYARMGDYRKALDNYLKALDMSQEVLGENHPKNVSLCDNIASIYGRLNDTEKRMEYFLKGLEINKSIYGEASVEVARSYEKIAKMYKSLRNFEKALEYQAKLAEVYDVLNGVEYEAGNAYSHLAEIYEKLEDSQKALEAYLKAIEIRKTSCRNRLLANSYQKVAKIYKSLKDYQKAVEYHMKATETLEEVFGDENSQTAISYENLAGAYRRLGDYQKALESYLKSLEINKFVYGEFHRETAASYDMVSEAYFKLRDFEKALEHQTRLVKIYETLDGEANAGTATAYSHLAGVYLKLKDYQKALEFQLKALKVRKFVYGETHQDTARSYDGLAVTYSGLKEYEKALEYERKLIEIYKAVYGETHAETAISYHNLAKIFEKMKDYEGALKYHLKALEIGKSVFEEGDEQITLSENNVAEMRRMLGVVAEGQDENVNLSLEPEDELLGKRTALAEDDEEKIEPDVEKRKKQ